MYPILFKLGPLSIYSYGLMVAIGFFVAVFLAQKQAYKFNIPKGFIPDLGFWIIISGIFGARLFYILENLKDYALAPKEIFMLSHGGLSFFGGLFAAIFTAVVVIRKNKFSVSNVFDLCAPFVALAQSIGRIGCFLNGCCYGNNTIIPIQIISSLSLLSLFIFLRFLQAKKLKTGLIFFNYLFFYSLGRFIIEFFRADNPKIFAGLTLFQMVSLGILIGASFCLLKITNNQIPACRQAGE